MKLRIHATEAECAAVVTRLRQLDAVLRDPIRGQS
jgi:hypothetical protein